MKNHRILTILIKNYHTNLQTYTKPLSLIKIILKETICIKRPLHTNNSYEKPLYKQFLCKTIIQIICMKNDYAKNSYEKPLYKQFV